MAMKVSILCATYNQERYIACALDSFLMQETDFDFEILVHDDASTDRTTEIVRDYELMYPGVVKPLFQTENQYSKGVKITALNAARAKGKYLALCEGDDYWTDPQKLQIQVNLMEADPASAVAVHSTVRVSPECHRIGELRPAKASRSFTTEEVIVEDSGFFHFSSLLFPATYISELPDYYFRSPVGDWPLILFLSSRGTVRYIDREMSAYRTHAVNSWTLRYLQNQSMQDEVGRGLAEMLIAFDDSTRHAYSAAVEWALEKLSFQAALRRGEYAEAKRSRVYKRVGWRSRVAITMSQHCPRVLGHLMSVKGLVEARVGRRS